MKPAKVKIKYDKGKHIAYFEQLLWNPVSINKAYIARSLIDPECTKNMKLSLIVFKIKYK